MVLLMNKLESPSPKDALCQIWLKLAQWFWGKFFFNISSMYFRYFVVLSPLGKGLGPSFEETTADNGQILIRKAHLSLRLR